MPSHPAGFQPVPRDPSTLPYTQTKPDISLSDLPLPSSDLIERAKEFLKPVLGEKVWGHSHRAFLFGMCK
jgi:cyanamide hydratase